MIGRTVGHYRILERLGGGGMGVVYKAEDLTLGRFVALKFLPAEMTRDPEAKGRFLLEARAASLLDHPNICTVHEVAEAGEDRLFIAMSYYEGETLRALLDRGALAVREALRLGTQILRGLAKAHAQGIVHRDIKPANIIVTAEGVAKILDFGLAKLVGSAHITKSKTTLGTLAYMAPEQLLGDAVGPQTDLWAAGVVLFEALTGQRPFRGEYAQSIAYSIVNEQPASLLELLPEAPGELDRIIRKMLRKDPAQRYQRAEEVLVELDPLRTSNSGPIRAAGPRITRPREALRAGAKLGPYEIAEPIGSGGMGDVYRARDTRLDRQVAIKVLAPEFSEDDERRQRFQREAKTISSLSHPNICTLFDVGEQEGIDYLVMEYLEGETLADRLAKGALPLNELMKIGIQVGEALGAAHRQGVIHRDLKPGNVMLTTAGAVKLVDFGLAKDIGAVTPGPRHPESSDKPLTAEGAIIGTLAYMAPEQIEGREADARTDIFALGAILYEMATGRRAFEGPTRASLIVSVLEREPSLLAATREVNEGSERGIRSLAVIEHVVRQCLEKDPEQRWQSAVDVARELRWVGDRNAQYSTLSTMQVRRRWGTAGWIVAALSLALLGSTGWLVRRALHAEESSDVKALPKLSRLTWEPGLQSNPAISPDGASFAYVSNESENADIYFRRIGGEAAINLTKDSPVHDWAPSFSPDGRSIVFSSARDGGGLFIMGATGESVRRLTDFGWWPDWSPDGKTVLFSSASGTLADEDPGIWLVDVATGTKRKVFDGDATRPAWSPSGTRIAFYLLGRDKGTIATIPVTGGRHTTVFETAGTVLSLPEWTRDWIWFTSNEGGEDNLWRVAVDEATGARSGDAEQVTLSTSFCTLPSGTVDGRKLLFVAADRTYSYSLHTIDPARGTVAGKPAVILSGPRALMGYLPSPDGQWVATVFFEGEIQDIVLIRTKNGETRRLTNDALREEAFAWTDDGSKLYFNVVRDGRNEVWAINSDGGGRERVDTGPGNSDVVGLALSRNGQLLYASIGKQSRIQVIDLAAPPAQRKAVPLPPLPDGREFSFETQGGVSRDGRWILGIAREDLTGTERDAYLFDVEHKSYRKFTKLSRSTQAMWLPDSRRILLLRLDNGGLSVLDRATGAIVETGSIGQPLVAAALSGDGRSLISWKEDYEGDIWMLDYGASK